MNEEKPEPLGAETLIFEAEERISWDALKAFYKERGIKCLNCPAAEVETFAEGAKLHKFDLDEHLAELNQLMLDRPFDGYPKGWFGSLIDKIKGTSSA